MNTITKPTDGTTADSDTKAEPIEIDPRIFDLYDELCHSDMDRRTFLSRVVALGIVGGVAMATSLLPRYAEAAMIKFTDPRIKATYVEYDSPGGNSGRMRGYLVRPTGDGPFPAIIVIHENRGLNPLVPHAFDYGEPIDLGKHDVDDRRSIARGKRHLGSFNSFAGHVDGIAGFPQSLGDVVGNRAVVLNDQNLHFAWRSRPDRKRPLIGREASGITLPFCNDSESFR